MCCSSDDDDDDDKAGIITSKSKNNDNVQEDPQQKVEVETSNSEFHIKTVRSLAKSLGWLPLPTNGYYLHPDGIVNILSLAEVAKEFRILMDTTIDNTFYVMDELGGYIRFDPQSNGMYGATIELGWD